MPIKTETVTEETDLLFVIQEGLKSDRKWIDQKGRLYASTSGFCPRQTALSITYSAFQEDSAATTEYFKLGIAIEDTNIQALRKQNKLLFSQYELPDIGLNLGGKVDGVYCLDDQHIKLLEIKSCGDLPDKPYPEHIAQASIYSAICGLPITLLYSSRNVAEYSGELLKRKFEISFDDVYLRPYVFNMVYGKYCAEAGYMPNKPIELNKEYKCGFCRFKPICWHDKPSHLKPFDSTDESMRIADFYVMERASDKTDEILDMDNVISRRNGILKHLYLYGSDFAHKLLDSIEWKNVV